MASSLPAIVVLAQSTPAEAATEVRGRIVDAESRDPVYLAEVSLVGAGLRTTTDTDGLFQFREVAPGTYKIRATRLGYEQLVREGVWVRSGDELDLELPMSRVVVPLEEITVTPGTFSFMDADASTRQTMSREDIESVPQLGEDVFRAVNRLPGLSSGDYSAHFSIRGGRHDETLILLDGLEL
jgi:hypothetical protein